MWERQAERERRALDGRRVAADENENKRNDEGRKAVSVEWESGRKAGRGKCTRREAGKEGRRWREEGDGGRKAEGGQEGNEERAGGKARDEKERLDPLDRLTVVLLSHSCPLAPPVPCIRPNAQRQR
jgi:hypothetical protein